MRTWDKERRCGECCNGDRCDDNTHFDRSRCPYCKATGWALWTQAGREDYVKYLQGWHGMSEQGAREAVQELTVKD